MIVETKKIVIDSKLECASGEALKSFELMTDFYGELNEKKEMFHVKQEKFTINSTNIRHIDVINVR